MPAAPRAASAWLSEPDPPAPAVPVPVTSFPGCEAASLMQRLTSRPQFQAVMAGSTVSRTPHFALHRSDLDSSQAVRPLFPIAEPWLGVLLPKRWAKRAVTRNSIRRQIYEAARVHGSLLPTAAYVVRLRSAFNRESYPSATSDALKQAVRNELDTLLTRAAAPSEARTATRAPHAG